MADQLANNQPSTKEIDCHHATKTGLQTAFPISFLPLPDNSHKKQDQDAIRSAELYGYLTCGQIPVMGYLTVHVHVIVLTITVYVHGTHLLLNRCVHYL